MRQSLFQQVPARKDLEGIQNGVNYEVTAALLHGSKLDDAQRNRLRCLWEGRAATEERAVKRTGGDPACHFCERGVPETSLHMSKECPRFAQHSFRLLQETSEQEREAWPPCKNVRLGHLVFGMLASSLLMARSLSYRLALGPFWL